MRGTFRTVVAFCLGTSALTLSATAATFQGLALAQTPGLSMANGISADGSTIVGVTASVPASAHTFQAFRWTPATALTTLTVPTGLEGFANSISADGTTVVGYTAQSGNVVPPQSVRWGLS